MDQYIKQIEELLYQGYDFGCGVVCQGEFEGMFKAWIEKDDWRLEQLGTSLNNAIELVLKASNS